MGAQHDVLGTGVPVAVERETDRGAPQLLLRHMHRGQGGKEVGGERGVVVSHERHVLGDPQARRPQSVQGPGRHDIGGRHDRAEPGIPVEEFTYRPATVLPEATGYVPPRTRETVAGDTPGRAATSRTVARSALSDVGFLPKSATLPRHARDSAPTMAPGAARQPVAA